MIFFFTQLISHCYSFLDSDPDSEELEFSLDESHETDRSLLCPEILSDNSVDDDDSNNDKNNGNNEEVMILLNGAQKLSTYNKSQNCKILWVKESWVKI